MGVTEEGTSMGDENKNKAGSPSKKVIGFFYFETQPNERALIPSCIQK